MRRIARALFFLGVLTAAALVLLKLVTQRRPVPGTESAWPPQPRPPSGESLVPEEVISVVDEPVAPEVAEEVEGAAEDAGVATTGAAEDSAAEQVEREATLVDELLPGEIEPADAPANFVETPMEPVTPDEVLALERDEGLPVPVEEVAAEEELAAQDAAEAMAREAELVEELLPGEIEPADAPANFVENPMEAVTPDEVLALERDEGLPVPVEEVAAEEELAAQDAAEQVGRGAELAAEVLGEAEQTVGDLATAEGVETESGVVTPDEALALERDTGMPVPAAEVAEAMAPNDDLEDVVTRAFLELAATEAPATEAEATAGEPVADEAPKVADAVPEIAPAEAPTDEAEVENPAETSSADWIPAEEKAFEPLSTGVASEPDLALADTLEEALGDLTPGAVTPRPARNAESYLDEGNVYFNVGQFSLAIERYSRAIELDETLTAAFYNRANARTRAGEFDGALEDYDKALGLAPNDADALNNRGMLHLYRQHYSAALRDFNAALAEDPADTTVMVNRGLAHLHGGDPSRAAEDFQEATSLDPGDAAAHYGSAQASAALGRRDEALNSIQRALQIDPGYGREAAGDPRLAILQGDEHFMRLLRESGTRSE